MGTAILKLRARSDHNTLMLLLETAVFHSEKGVKCE